MFSFTLLTTSVRFCSAQFFSSFAALFPYLPLDGKQTEPRRRRRTSCRPQLIFRFYYYLHCSFLLLLLVTLACSMWCARLHFCKYVYGFLQPIAAVVFCCSSCLLIYQLNRIELGKTSAPNVIAKLFVFRIEQSHQKRGDLEDLHE